MGLIDPYIKSHTDFLKLMMNILIIPHSNIPTQGRWAIYGIGLPDEVLRKVYYENASRVLNIPIPD